MLIALLVCLIPTTIGALLSAIGIAGMDRLVQRNVLATSGRQSRPPATSTRCCSTRPARSPTATGRRSPCTPPPDVPAHELAVAARLSSLADQTPEGRSIVELCAREHGLPTEATREEATAGFVPFTAQTRMSGLDLADGRSGRSIRKGAGSAVAAWVSPTAATLPPALEATVECIGQDGGTPLVVAERSDGTSRVLGVVQLADVVKPGMRERFAELRAMGIRSVMITGDNPLTARAIAGEAGVDDHLAEATPEDKMTLIRREQEGGRLVAMTGDGTNDAPALPRPMSVSP